MCPAQGGAVGERRRNAMPLKAIKTDKAPAAIGPYSQAVSAGPFQFISGQLGLHPKTGELAGVDLASQARQALENLKQIVVSGGGRLDQIAAVDVYLTDIGHFAEFNRIYADFFVDHRPARAVVEVSALPKGGLVEIKCVVYTGS